MMNKNMMVYKTLTGGILDNTSRMTNCANRQNHHFQGQIRSAFSFLV